jgi:hypothetical protein
MPSVPPDASRASFRGEGADAFRRKHVTTRDQWSESVYFWYNMLMFYHYHQSIIKTMSVDSLWNKMHGFIPMIILCTRYMGLIQRFASSIRACMMVPVQGINSIAWDIRSPRLKFRRESEIMSLLVIGVSWCAVSNS